MVYHFLWLEKIQIDFTTYLVKRKIKLKKIFKKCDFFSQCGPELRMGGMGIELDDIIK